MVSLLDVTKARDDLASGLQSLAEAEANVGEDDDDGIVRVRTLMHLVSEHLVTPDLASAYLLLQGQLPSNKTVEKMTDEELWEAMRRLEFGSFGFTMIVTEETVDLPMFEGDGDEDVPNDLPAVTCRSTTIQQNLAST